MGIISLFFLFFLVRGQEAMALKDFPIWRLIGALGVLLIACSLRKHCSNFYDASQQKWQIGGVFRYVANPVELAAFWASLAPLFLFPLPLRELGAYLAVVLSFLHILSSYRLHCLRIYKSADSFERYRKRVRRWFPRLLPAANPLKLSAAKKSVYQGFSYDFLWLVVLIGLVLLNSLRPFEK